MNREIKFRGWDNLKKKMVGDPHWELSSTGTEYLNDTLESLDSVYTLMQYTGLKDKNGKEIYEGDIVFDEDGEFSKTCKIEWDEIGARFFGIAIEDDDSYEMQEIDGEIIGNIYENPELLK